MVILLYKHFLKNLLCKQTSGGAVVVRTFNKPLASSALAPFNDTTDRGLNELLNCQVADEASYKKKKS